MSDVIESEIQQQCETCGHYLCRCGFKGEYKCDACGQMHRPNPTPYYFCALSFLEKPIDDIQI